MTERALQRTVRRGIAVLLLPLLVIVIQFDIHLRKQAGLVNSSVVNTSELFAYAAIVGILVYLFGSGVLQFYSSVQ